MRKNEKLKRWQVKKKKKDKNSVDKEKTEKGWKLLELMKEK